tara:strand:+ start:44608 stop:44814 length:207 start_codon:yes stop_codon:yes gene_type:complete
LQAKGFNANRRQAESHKAVLGVMLVFCRSLAASEMVLRQLLAGRIPQASGMTVLETIRLFALLIKQEC